jgi:hypothetical protein
MATGEHDEDRSPLGASFLRSGRGRTALVIGIFLLVVFSARGKTAPQPGLTGRSPAAISTEADTWPRRLLDLATDSTGAGSGGTVGVENFLSRFDAMVRSAEMKALTTKDPHADSTVHELRSLRRQTYETLRRALPDSSRNGNPASPPNKQHK